MAERGMAEHDDFDPVDHPPHYGGDTPYEAIKVIEAWGLGFHLGNTVKYISRAGKKDENLMTDLEKARWYLDRYITSLAGGVEVGDTVDESKKIEVRNSGVTPKPSARGKKRRK